MPALIVISVIVFVIEMRWFNRDIWPRWWDLRDWRV